MLKFCYVSIRFAASFFVKYRSRRKMTFVGYLNVRIARIKT